MSRTALRSCTPRVSSSRKPLTRPWERPKAGYSRAMFPPLIACSSFLRRDQPSHATIVVSLVAATGSRPFRCCCCPGCCSAAGRSGRLSRSPAGRAGNHAPRPVAFSGRDRAGGSCQRIGHRCLVVPPFPPGRNCSLSHTIPRNRRQRKSTPPRNPPEALSRHPWASRSTGRASSFAGACRSLTRSSARPCRSARVGVTGISDMQGSFS